MTDYLFIDTDRTRNAATHLRTMHGGGEDLLSDIRIAASLAELADSIANDFDAVSEALVELAAVLDQRSNLADNGHIMTARSSAAQLMGISQVLWGYDSPTTDELFPEIGPRTTRTASSDKDHPVAGFGGWLDDRFDDAVDWIGEQPIAPPPLVPMGPLGDVVEFVGDSLDVIDPDWLVGWPTLDPISNAVAEALSPYVVASLSAGVGPLTVGVATSAIDGDPRAGVFGSISLRAPAHAEVLFHFTGDPPTTGTSESFGACAVVCLGVTKSDNGIDPFIGLGTPQVIYGTTGSLWGGIKGLFG